MAADAKFKPQKEINRLKSQIRKLERQKDKGYPDLGRSTYQAFLEGRLKEPALTEACQEFKELDSQIEQSRAEIARVQEQAKAMQAQAAAPSGAACPFCGAEVTAGSRFCGNCGKEVVRQAAPQAATCSACGSAISPGAKFCGDCGKTLEETPKPPPTAAPVSEPPPPAAARPTPPPAPPAPPSPPQPAAPEKPSSEQVVPSEAGKKCPSCGAAAEEKDAIFCGECGAKFE